jgi:hypothetical protein
MYVERGWNESVIYTRNHFRDMSADVLSFLEYCQISSFPSSAQIEKFTHGWPLCSFPTTVHRDHLCAILELQFRSQRVQMSIFWYLMRAEDDLGQKSCIEVDCYSSHTLSRHGSYRVGLLEMLTTNILKHKKRASVFSLKLLQDRQTTKLGIPCRTTGHYVL